ncbi:MAG: VCBS repeat-containing protein [Deltaproteobacteria bacterium]|nr:VCBS repeat-containing protein [Deltaproteobacteria bacterium]
MNAIRKTTILALCSLCSVLVTGCGADGLVDSDFTTRLSLVSFQPECGPVDGGARLTLIGANFRTGDRVFFGQTAGTEVAVQGDSALQVTSPPGDFGPVELRVCRSSGECTAFEKPFRYRAESIRMAFQEDLGRVDYDGAFASGDFDADGRPDLAVASGGQLRQYLATDEGLELVSKQSVPRAMDFTVCCAGLQAIEYTLLAADFDADGTSDLALSVDRSPDLYIFQGRAGRGLGEAELYPHPELLFECQNHFMDWVDLDGNAAGELLVLNNSGDPVRRPCAPDYLGPVGVILGLSGGESRTLLADDIDCDSVHSHFVLRGPPDELVLLCQRGDELSSVRVALVGDGLVVVGEGLLLAGLEEAVERYHLVDLDADGEPELVWLRELDLLPGTYRRQYAGAVSEIGTGSPTEIGSFEFNCSLDPHVLAADLQAADGRDELVVLCPYDNIIHHVVLQPEGSLDAMTQFHFLDRGDLQGPDFANCYAGGQPMIPPLGALDMDGDGRDELLLPGRWGDLRMIRAHPVADQRMPRFSSMPRMPDASEPAPGSWTSWWTRPRTYLHGRPSGMLVDLDQDGRDDLVRLHTKPGLSIRMARSDGSLGPAQEIDWGPATGLYSMGVVLIEDLDADGRLDFAVPARDGRFNETRLDFVLGSAGGYVHADYQTLTDLWPEHIQIARIGDSGRLAVAAWVEDGDGGRLLRFEGAIDSAFELIEVQDGFGFESGLFEMLDLDLDGELDLMGYDGRVCWGGELDGCAGSAEAIFEVDLQTISNLGAIFDPREQAYQVIVLDEGGGRGQWLTLRGREVEPRAFEMDLPGSFVYYLEAGRTCDVDGDGRGELLFLGIQPNQISPAVLALRPREGESGVEWLSLGFPDVSPGELACTDLRERGTDDLLLADSYGLLYLVQNRSR